MLVKQYEEHKETYVPYLSDHARLTYYEKPGQGYCRCGTTSDQFKKRSSIAKVKYLWNFNNIKHKSQDMAIMMQVNRPGNKGTMIGGSPRIGCDMDLTRMLLQNLVNTLPRDLE